MADTAAASREHIVVVGAGLVGSLLSVALGQKGYQVTLLERRDDPRQGDEEEETKNPFGAAGNPTKRSINLALSQRGIEALESVGLKEIVMERVIPMSCRAMHAFDGKLTFQPYGSSGQAINSVSRGMLNELLLDEAEKNPNVTVQFNCKVTKVTKDSVVVYTQNGTSTRINARLVVGSDGAYSSVRSAMMRLMRLDYSQHYIAHGYKELTMPAVTNKDGSTSYCMDVVNALHIWPRHEFMMIALPNTDKSFTCTLFAPFSLLDQFDKDPEFAETTFNATFPDAVPHMGNVAQQIKENPTGTLVTVHTKPWNFEDKIVLMGDAAHALVPFYGQGMNAGFEDVSTFMKVLASCGNDLARAVPEWAKSRKPDGDAIAELSYKNYAEMRSHTASTTFLMRKRFEAALHAMFPRWWIPLYTMVAFTDIPYSEAIKRGEQQDRAINRLVRFGVAMLALGVVGGGAYGFFRSRM